MDDPIGYDAIIIAIIGAIPGIVALVTQRRRIKAEAQRDQAESVKTYADAAKEYAEEVRKLRAESSILYADFDKQRDQMDGLHHEVVNLTDSIRSREEAIEELKRQIQQLTLDNQRKDDEIAALQTRIQEQQATIEALTAELRAFKRDTGPLKGKT